MIGGRNSGARRRPWWSGTTGGAAAAARAQTTVILVTNEVGCGIVPENALARQFRDAAGKLNQMAAESAAEVHWMIFGVGLRIK